MYTVISVQTHIIQTHFVMTALEFVRQEALMTKLMTINRSQIVYSSIDCGCLISCSFNTCCRSTSCCSDSRIFVQLLIKHISSMTPLRKYGNTRVEHWNTPRL